jgi:diguanylate cyclase (GGDEF)-like protein
MDTAGFLAVAGLQLLAAASLLSLPREWRRKQWVSGLIVGVGIAAVCGAVYFNGERLGAPPSFNELFYVWPAFYSGYFLRRRGVILSIVGIAAAYAATLVAIDAGGPTAWTRWIVTVSVVAGAAIAMHGLRLAIDRLLDRLREAARTDPLRMLLNRRGFGERFELEIDRARRTGSPVALVLGDLDRFKELNDDLVHPTGDTALICVGQALTLGCRTIDTVARVGGEEFAILLPASGADDGREVAERLRAEIRQLDCGDDDHPITISFGVVEFPTHGDSPRELMLAADRALYVAKKRGRDRTVAGGVEAAAA